MKKNKKVILLAIGACVISLATLSVFADGEGSPQTQPVSTTYVSGSCNVVNGSPGCACVCYDTTTIVCKGTALSDCAGSSTRTPDYQCTCTKQTSGLLNGRFACVPNTWQSIYLPINFKINAYCEEAGQWPCLLHILNYKSEDFLLANWICQKTA